MAEVEESALDYVLSPVGDLILRFLKENGPSCGCWITTEIYTCEYLSVDFMRHLPKVLSAAFTLRSKGELIMDEPGDAEVPWRLPNQQLSNYKLNA